MNFPNHIWKQLKNTSARKLISALRKDGFILDEEIRTERIYRHPDGRKTSIHYHTGSTTYGPKLLKGLIKDTGWMEDDLKRLKLIK